MPVIEILLQTERSIHPQAVRSLYTSVNWWPERTIEQIARVLDADAAVGAWDGERLIGFARAVSDSVLRAYIEDVVVHPDYQRRGVGKRMLTRLIKELSQIETVTLFCAPELVPFYATQGFSAFPSQVVMHRKRPAPERAADESR